jgi:hypothetical protein
MNIWITSQRFEDGFEIGYYYEMNVKFIKIKCPDDNAIHSFSAEPSFTLLRTLIGKCQFNFQSLLLYNQNPAEISG